MLSDYVESHGNVPANTPPPRGPLRPPLRKPDPPAPRASRKEAKARRARVRRAARPKQKRPRWVKELERVTQEYADLLKAQFARQIAKDPRGFKKMERPRF